MHRYAVIALFLVSASFSFAAAKPKPSKNPHAVVTTSLGTFEAELYQADAPKTVENFVGLAKKKFYNGVRFHRVIKGFVIQGGDDKTKDVAKRAQWGSGGQSIWGKEFADELNSATPSFKAGYQHGVLAMANRGPNTNTSQFFVCLEHAGLPHQYTIFGKVIKGLDVVDKIGATPTGQGDVPKSDVFIKSIVIK
jgi:cyclophilin family peptidyl-prolyl cis-trans isomerase